jgi:DNA-binding beta-propeller fold protein YncE
VLARDQLLYVADSGNNVVLIYDQAGTHQTPIGEITTGLNGPEGATTDVSGSLYVVNAGYPGEDTQVFAPGRRQPSRTLVTENSCPEDVAVAHDGTVFVEIRCFHTFAVYQHGASTPTYYVDDSTIYLPLGIAVNAKGTLYLDYCVEPHCPTVSIVTYAPGSMGPGKGTGINLPFARGMRFDAKGNLVIADPETPAIDVFPPGAKLPRSQFGKTGQPEYIAFNEAKTRLFVTDASTERVLVYDYPSGRLVNTMDGIPGTSMTGVAAFPAPPL